MKRDFTSEMKDDYQQNKSQFEGEENPENTWIFFLLSPKWVRMRPTDAHYTVHPRAQGSQFRMSTAGSSVLLSLGSSMFDPMESVHRSRNEKSHDDEGMAQRPAKPPQFAPKIEMG